MWWSGGHSRSKLGCAYRIRMKLVSQLQAQVPDPLADNTPCLLTASGVTTPTIRADLLIFVRKLRFKGTAMQVQLNHIAGREGVLRQFREEQFVDDACTGNADRTLLLSGRMGRDDYAAGGSLGTTGIAGQS